MKHRPSCLLALACLGGARVRCYLDGELVHDATAPETEQFYAVAGCDETRGDIVLKAINTDA